MATNGDVEAKRLGEKLLLDVQVEGLSSILASLRALEPGIEGNETTNKSPFNIPELDVFTADSSPTILELVSPPHTHHPSGAGKTSLLYLVIAQAILPSSTTATPNLNGHSAAIILFDPLHHFSIPRLSSTILSLLVSALGVPLTTVSPSTRADLLSLTARSLDHLHIFHPSSWASLLSTLRSLPDYLLGAQKHKSMHRRIHSLLLDDIDAFAPSIRHTSSDATNSSSNAVSALSAASRALTSEVHKLMALLSCNAVLTSSSVVSNSFRPALPASLGSGVSVVRLAVRRVEVLRFAPEMSIEQAETERDQRWEVVKRGRFECWRVGAGGGDGAGDGFVFRVGMHGVEIERESGA